MIIIGKKTMSERRIMDTEFLEACQTKAIRWSNFKKEVFKQAPQTLIH